MATLDKGERSVLATFSGYHQAKEALESLKGAGFDTAQIDTVNKYPGEPDSNYNSAISGRAYSLSSLTLYGDGGSSGDAGPLMAADPSASGLAQGGDLPGFSSVLVTVVTNEDRLQEAVSLLKSHGGEV